MTSKCVGGFTLYLQSKQSYRWLLGWTTSALTADHTLTDFDSNNALIVAAHWFTPEQIKSFGYNKLSLL